MPDYTRHPATLNREEVGIRMKPGTLTSRICALILLQCPQTMSARDSGFQEQSGCVLKSEKDGRFIYHHMEEGHHHHLVCRACGKSIDCNEDIFSGVEDILMAQYGFTADFKHIMVSGHCKSCRSQEK